MHRVADLRTYLSGSWRIDRRFDDRRHALDGTMLGEAQFSPNGDALLYREGGAVSFGSYQGAAEQKHRYDFPDEASRASVFFDDGRPFHELDLSNGTTLVSHACGDDLYQGRFIALTDERWESRWTVVGPRKDQRISTLYTRIG
jgi:hypothetical protein